MAALVCHPIHSPEQSRRMAAARRRPDVWAPRRVAAIAFAAILAMARIAIAQDDVNNGITLNGEMELARLVDLTAKRLSLDVEYDAAAIKGTVTIRVSSELTNDELWQLTNELLAARGFATVQRPGSRLVSVVKLADAPGGARLDRAGDTSDRAGFASVILRAEHREPKALIEAIKHVLSKPSGAIVQLADGPLLLVTDYRSRIEQAEYIKGLIDVPAAEVAIQTVIAEHLKPSELIALVAGAVAGRDEIAGRKLRGKLIASPDGRSIILTAPPEDLLLWRGLIATFDQRSLVETRTYTPRHFAPAEVSALLAQTARDSGPKGSGDRWKIVVDDLTGTLIVTATPSEHEAIKEVIERLEAAPPGSRRQMRTYIVKNRPVKEVVTLLNDLVSTGQLGAADTDLAVAETPKPSPEAVAQRTERDVLPMGATPLLQPPAPPAKNSNGGAVRTTRHSAPGTAPNGASGGGGGGGGGEPVLTITADEGTNSIIVVGEPRVLAQVEQILKTLDLRQPQVMLEVLFVQLTDNQSMELGVELSKMEISGSTLWSLSSLFGIAPPIPAPTSTTTAAVAPTANVPALQGFTGVVLRPGDFSVLVHALEQINKGKALNIPKVLVTNNADATLTSLLQQPVLSTNASTTVATTSFGGTQDAGTTVKVRPQIAERDHLILDYSVAISNFVGSSSNPSLPPPRQQNTLQSIVTIPDGYTVAVGGLQLEFESQSVSQIPFVGDIPLIGEIFKNRVTSDNKSKFYVFIRANVLRHGAFEDLKYISELDQIAAKLEPDVPVVEPRVIR